MRLKLAREAKVTDFDMALGIQQNVFELQVTMHDALCMDVGHCVA